MIGPLGRLLHGPAALAQFVRYCVIGCTVFCVDVGSFQLMIQLRVLLWAAVILAYGLGVIVHFLLNRYWNFRAFERSFVQQGRTHLIVTAAQLGSSLAIIELGVHVIRMSPLDAKVLAAFVNMPFSFLAHKNLTFNAGIRALLRGSKR